MTHYVGPRATYTATSGHEACARCGGRGSLRYAPTGRHVSRAYYGETAFLANLLPLRGHGAHPGVGRRSSSSPVDAR